MSVLDIPLRKALQFFYAPQSLRRTILKKDIRLDRRKEAGGTRSRGGDFYFPFWSDVKRHISGDADLTQLTDDRIKSNRNFKRLYPLLKDGVLELLGAKLRWSNEPVEIVPQSVHRNLRIEDLDGTIRIRDALHARVKGEYTRVVYPYFSEEPPLPEEGGRLGLPVSRTCLYEGTGTGPSCSFGSSSRVGRSTLYSVRAEGLASAFHVSRFCRSDPFMAASRLASPVAVHQERPGK